MKMNKFVIQFCKKQGRLCTPNFGTRFKNLFLGNDKNRGVSVFCFFNTNEFLELFLWNNKNENAKNRGASVFTMQNQGGICDLFL